MIIMSRTTCDSSRHDEPEVVSRFHRAVGERERARSRPRRHRLDHVEQQVASDETEHRRHIVDTDRLAGEGHDLVERALRVAHAALGRARDQRQRRVRHLDALRRRRSRASCSVMALVENRAELEDLRTREDGVRDLVQLGRRHHEDDVRRRLLDRLQQCVERGGRELMDLVDDEDLVAVARRAKSPDPAMTTSRMLSMPVWLAASISSTSMSRPCAISMQASHSPHGSGVGPVDAVQRPRQDARRRRLAAAARAREHERVRDAPARNGVAQRARHRLLPDDIVEALWPPFAREDLIGHYDCNSSTAQLPIIEPQLSQMN